MSLYDNINSDVKDAMKAKDNLKTTALRCVMAKIKDSTVNANPPKQIDDIIVGQVVKKEIKQINESIENFTKGNRLDLVEIEKKRLSFLEKYCPKMMSEDEVKTLVAKILKENNMTSKKDMGRAMKLVIEACKGKADGSIISKFVKEILV